MTDKLVAYFSNSHTTEDAAKKLAKALKADILQIIPEVPYTPEDLDWQDPKSRSSIEMNDPTSRPKMRCEPLDPTPYKTVYLGFPIWWYTAPRIINTFLEAYDFSGKDIVIFATSGSSDLGHTAEDLKVSLKENTMIHDGFVVHTTQPYGFYEQWVERYGK